MSDLEGHYRVSGVPVGTQELRVQRIGQKPQSVPSVAVRSGTETKVDISVIRRGGEFDAEPWIRL